MQLRPQLLVEVNTVLLTVDGPSHWLMLLMDQSAVIVGFQYSCHLLFQPRAVLHTFQRWSFVSLFCFSFFCCLLSSLYHSSNPSRILQKIDHAPFRRNHLHIISSKNNLLTMLNYHPTTNQLSDIPFYCSCYKDPYKDLEESDLIMRLKKIAELNSVFSFNKPGLRCGFLSALVFLQMAFYSPLERRCATTRKCPFLFLQQLALLSSFLHFSDYHNICIASVLGHNA